MKVNQETVEILRPFLSGEQRLLYQDILTVLSVASDSSERVAKTLWRNHHPVGGAEVRDALRALREVNVVKFHAGKWHLHPHVLVSLDAILCSV